MKSVTQHLRDRIEKQLSGRPPLHELRKTEWSKTFERMMKSRLLMGAFRYGLKENKGDQEYDLVGSLKARIRMYEESGNLEYLVDCANLALLEFEFPSHSKAHFDAVDDGEHCF